jgi:hypothetical protein
MKFIVSSWRNKKDKASKEYGYNIQCVTDSEESTNFPSEIAQSLDEINRLLNPELTIPTSYKNIKEVILSIKLGANPAVTVAILKEFGPAPTLPFILSKTSAGSFDEKTFTAKLNSIIKAAAATPKEAPSP